MRTLADPIERKALLKLSRLVREGKLSGTNAWTCFSSPALEKTFGKKNVESYQFTLEEVEAYRSLKKKTVQLLERKSYRFCSYCRRTVGNYGFGWHIEHIMCKSKHQDLTFALKNLVLACIDCNMWKNVRVDRKASPYDIINPQEAGFDYGLHLNFGSVATEKLCIIKYLPLSNEGQNTYEKLRFDLLERSTILTSLQRKGRSRLDELSLAAEQFAGVQNGHPMAKFLVELKGRLSLKMTP